jgi:hypothetical protein
MPRFHLPALGDRVSIQRALAKVVSRVIGGRLDPAAARVMVFGLQLANCNLLGDPHPLSALIQQAQSALDPVPACPLPDLLRSLRPPPPSPQKMYGVQD